MSEFLKQLQGRLQVKKPGLEITSTQNQANLGNSLKSLLGGLKDLRLPSSNPLSQIPVLMPKGIKPSQVSTSITYIVVLATAACFAYWVLRIAQIPGTPGTSPNAISKGMMLYSNQDGTSAYGLFGSKPLVTDNIFLRGVVITSKGADGRLDGFAIFEIDGKPTNAISVGENLGKGLTLQSIGDESATLVYEGQKLDFKLSKAGNKSNSPNKK